MPKIYLSPSTQESNPYITGSGSEEYNMNRLADALEPYLYANGIRFVRNTPDMTAASSIAQANRLGGFDFYLALHSNAAAPENSGSVRGVLVFYYPTSAEGKRAADLFAANLKRVYPLPDLVRTVPTTALGEVRQPKYPANLLELGYHDNYADAAWVENNMDAIARELARSLTEYFGLPFIEPQPVVQGTVSTSGSPLRLRAYPSAAGQTIALMPNGASSTDLNKSPQSHSVSPIPPMPTKRPIGMPHMHSANASKRTDRLIWLRVAPIEASKPNCFVLSLTEIENAL